MLYNYESVLNPIGCDDHDEEVWYLQQELSKCSLDQLHEMHQRAEMRLDEHRAKEPAMKRKNKTDYRIWVGISNDYTERLRMIWNEILLRQENSDGHE